MQIGPAATNPFHIARAYGLQQARPAQVMRTAAPAMPAAPALTPNNIARLSAGIVPGGISFSADEAAVPTNTYPLYRHPADKNAAATAVLSAGRRIDVTG